MTKNTDFKRDAILETGLYEYDGEYFYGFKGIRSDRYSSYNFQFQYLKDETYECHADYSYNQNSFGLSVWDYENAKNYCSELVIKIKFKPEDVAHLVHNGKKIRVSKFIVLD
jgi:hypothetical protein